ncbi:MAG TPA: FAD-dependent monooxygenase, partial [Kribbella sp.]|nr:FAD-dependent monooxygenase [Kribbella sp.]
TAPELAAMVGRGNYWVFGPDRMLGAQRNGNGVIQVSISIQRPADVDPAAVLDLPTDWAPQFRRLLQACDEPFVVRPAYLLPIGLRWPRRSGVTLLGDAAHLMPSHGEGANQAMLDAVELGLAIAAHRDDLDSALEQYETAMYARTTEVAERSAMVAELMTGPDAAQKVLRFFKVADSVVD